MAQAHSDNAPFLRRTSGLTKTIGTFGAVVFGIHCISLSSSGFIPFSWVASNWPGASIVGLLVIAMLASMIHGYTFAAIGASMPRSGADYILASRLLSPKLAFVASWTLVIFSGVVAGGLVAFIPKSAFPALLQPMAIIFKNETYSNWATYASSPNGSMVIGTVFVLITLGLMMLPNRKILSFLSIGLILGFVAWGIIYYSLISASGPTAFKTAWDSFVGPTSNYGTFDQRIALAQAAGMSFYQSPYTMTLAGLIMGFWIFYGYYIPTFFAGEVREANTSRTLLSASWSAILITGGIFIIATLLLQRLVPLEWIAAEGYLNNNADQVTAAAGGKPVQALPWITFYAAILKPNFVLILIVAFAWIFTLVNLVQTYFFYASRIIFAWAFDRVIPRPLAEVSKRTNSPVLCMVVIALLAELGVIDASYFSGTLGTQLSFAFFAVVTQIVSVLAIIIFPFRAPQQFRLCPKFVTAKVFGFPVVSIVGTVTLIYLLWMVVASFLYPAVGIANPFRTVVLLTLIAATGFVVVTVAKWYRKKYEGIDISTIYKATPPA